MEADGSRRMMGLNREMSMEAGYFSNKINIIGKYIY